MIERLSRNWYITCALCRFVRSGVAAGGCRRFGGRVIVVHPALWLVAVLEHSECLTEHFYIYIIIKIITLNCLNCRIYQCSNLIIHGINGTINFHYIYITDNS